MLHKLLTVIALLPIFFRHNSSHELRLVNSCSFPVWAGTIGNFDQPHHPENGGFRLGANGDTRQFAVPNGWGGRIWGRTGCDGSGICETGDCGKIECAGASGIPPITLADITFDGLGDIDFYYLTLVDGYNLPIQMKPIPGTVEESDGGEYDCKTAGCISDLNAICPPELISRNSGGETIACQSACMVFNTDQYCCRGAFGRPDTCISTEWPVNYAAIFKGACPNAFSYVYDQTTSIFTCQSISEGSSSYEITFCPT